MDYGAQYGVQGDTSSVDLPRTEVSEKQLVEEKKLAKFSKTEEYKRLKDYLEGRIKFYQSYLPDGRPVTEAKSAEDWKIANAVIAEFNSVISTYEQAAEVLKDKK